MSVIPVAVAGPRFSTRMLYVMDVPVLATVADGVVVTDRSETSEENVAVTVVS